MIDKGVSDSLSAEGVRRFTKQVLIDLHALEQMLAAGVIERDVRRIGAEQELFLVDEHWRPAPVAVPLLARLDDPHFVHELGLFNLEFNVDPLVMGPTGDCLSRLEAEIDRLLGKAREAAAGLGAKVVMTGILPTLDKADLSLENMTPKPRYRALNDAVMRLRGGELQLRLKGRDDLLVRHENIMLEACNTSFQVHFQVTPEEFVGYYNVAQAIAGPFLAACANSPLLFGRQLWRETRIALFQQSLDTRHASSSGLREQTPRVSFGRRWVCDSVLEIYQEDLSRFPVLVGAETAEDPFAEIREGRAPKLEALRLYNGSVYRWNRPCYGLCDGRPHLRIENRVLPAGPSVIDQVANAALWFGLIRGVAGKYGDITRVLDFDAARENFTAAARFGIGSHLAWPGREQVAASELLLEELLPLARAGLATEGVRGEDIDRYLGAIEERLRSSRTGASWQIESLAAMQNEGTRGERLAALVASTHRHQVEGQPVHTWDLARLDEAGSFRSHYLQVGQLMTTDLFTVSEDDLVDLLAYVMNWKHIRHVPVEDSEHRLVGLVTHRALLRLIGQNLADDEGRSIPVSRIMHRDVVTATPEMSTLDAIRLMREKKVSGLPVVTDDQRLVGILTERDLMGLAGSLLERFLSEEPDPTAAPAGEPTIDDDAAGISPGSSPESPVDQEIPHA